MRWRSYTNQKMMRRHNVMRYHCGRCETPNKFLVFRDKRISEYKDEEDDQEDHTKNGQDPNDDIACLELRFHVPLLLPLRGRMIAQSS